MFNVGGGELLVILLVALIVLGPTKLPDAARQFGRVMNELRRLSSGFQREMREALDDPIEAAARDRGRKATQSTAAAAGMYPKGDPDGPDPDEDDDDTSDAAGEASGVADGTEPDGTEPDGTEPERTEADDEGNDTEATGEASGAPPVKRTTDLPTTTVFRPRTVEPPDEDDDDTSDAAGEASGVADGTEPDGTEPERTEADDEGNDTEATGEASGAPPVKRTTDLPTTTVFRPRTVEPPDEVEAAGG